MLSVNFVVFSFRIVALPSFKGAVLFFKVMNGSYIVPDQRLNMNQHQLNLSSTSTEALLDWVSQSLGPITTITEVKPSRTLVHTVGIGKLSWL